ncbi:EI24 domain-containing protein [Streptomyces sp. TRM 70351]|uniref:EI24 domain-containing protein n=1 Tax=Streptomyces sp. TRM 70351 TaxID=3116552 RepID=UPI002E7B5FB6|nr:EI24 domain-containing protein [Streptomyces sp. TRM 70351]MEE1930586.1 EI24 domain-containing protein [Streptomyces sp. TRM 70351]
MSDLASGARYLGRGLRWAGGHGRWYGFGLIPGAIALVLYAAALVVLALYAGDIAAWATPFADDWAGAWRTFVRVSFALLLFAGGLMLAVLTFTAVTLLIGDPFYEALSEKVEESEGGAPEGPDRPLWQELWRSLCDSLYVLMWAVVCAVPLFVLGFVPFVGQSVVPAVGLAVSGFFLTVELTSVALQRRDVPVRERMRMLRARKGLALGFGVPLAVSFLVPFVAVLLMPGAVAGATLLARDLAGTPAPRQPGPHPAQPRGGDAPAR